MKFISFRLTSLPLFAMGMLLSGCSSNFAPSPATPVQTSFGNISGTIMGGQQPIKGAHIYAYAASTTAYGGAGVTAGTTNASTSLLTSASVTGYTTVADGSGHYYVTTDASGYFKIVASATCTSGTQVYLYSTGGDSGSGVNTSAGLMAILGECPADGTLEDSVGTNTRVVMNEASTVAAAFATAGFATDPTHIGAPSATSSLAVTGIANAFANAAQLYSLTYGGGGARATTANGNGTVPQAELNAMANSLAACVNSNGAGTPCTTLKNDAKSGGSTGTSPTNTAYAAINIAHNPATNVTAIFNLGTTGPPFTPTLSTAPNDFTVQLIFTGGGITQPVYLSPRTLAVDAEGYVWNANFSGNTLSEFNPLGVPVTATGFTGSGLNEPFSAAVDTSGNVWVPNIAGNNLSVFNTAGGAVANYFTGLGLNEPSDAEFDASGNVFISNIGTNKLVKVGSTGGLLNTSTAGVENLTSPYSVALEPGTAGHVWAANSGTRYVSYLTNTLTGTSDKALGSIYDYQTGSAVDGSGNVWVTVDSPNVTGLVAKITTANVSTTYTPGSGQYYSEELDSVAIDGGGNAWLTDSDDGTLYEVSSAGATLSPKYGFILIGNTACAAACSTITAEPNSIALDGSGDVWYTTVTDTTLRELIGASVPVVTPIAYAVKNNRLGGKP